MGRQIDPCACTCCVALVVFIAVLIQRFGALSIDNSCLSELRALALQAMAIFCGGHFVSIREGKEWNEKERKRKKRVG